MRDKNIIALLVILSIVVKLVFLFGSGVYMKPGLFEYESIVNNMLNGGGFYYRHFHTNYYGLEAPGYILLCFTIYKLFGHNPLYVVFIQIVVTSLISAPIFLIARSIFDRKAAIIAAALAALYPPFIVYSTSKLHAMNVYSFLFILLTWSLIRLKERPDLRNAAFVGIAAGLAINFRFTTLPFLVLGLAWFCIVSHEALRKWLSLTFAILAISGAILSPWIVRNWIVFGKPVLLQTNKWEALWCGNAPGTTGSLYIEDNVTTVDKMASELPEEFYKMNELEQGEYLKKLTVGYFKDDPMGFIKRIIKKMGYFWYFSPHQGGLYPKRWMGLYKIYYLAILLPALLSIFYRLFVSKKGEKPAIVLICLFFAALTFTHSLYFVEARHRWSVEPLLLVFTAGGILMIIDGIRALAPRSHA
ncbi:MAG: glycosyltransferase family 39 protein [Candidatus Omnitrophica bacterium]|nr:glycosyltransferase family 39 protein [Candidatus Omnitrophota bacterium]